MNKQRNNKNYISILATVVFFFLFSVAPSKAGLFYPRTFTLKNGLQVVVITNKRAPVVKQFLLYKVGAIDEPVSKSGIAHFLEHLMFKGTKTISGEEFNRTIEELGGQQNALTSRDFTAYYQEVSKDALETIIRLESDRMANLVISEKDIDTERPVILEERRMRVDNEPSAILLEAVNASFFENHPYRLPLIGWEHEMEQLTKKDAVMFYRDWYAPNNAVLVFAGDVTVEEVKPLVKKYYGPIPAKVLPKRNIPQEPVHRGVVKIVKKTSPRVLHPFYMRFYAAPCLHANPKAVYALEVLDQILSNGANSYLYNELVTNQKVAVSASMTYLNPACRGPTVVYFSGQPSPGKSLEDLESAFLAFVDELVKTGISKQDIDKAKKRLVAGLDYMRDESFGGAFLMAQYLGNGYKLDDIENWENNILAVTPEEVNLAVKQLFNQDSYLIAHLLPQK